MRVATTTEVIGEGDCGGDGRAGIISSVESSTRAGDTTLSRKRMVAGGTAGRAMVKATLMVVVSLSSSPLYSTLPCVFVKRREKERKGSSSLWRKPNPRGTEATSLSLAGYLLTLHASHSYKRQYLFPKDIFTRIPSLLSLSRGYAIFRNHDTCKIRIHCTLGDSPCILNNIFFCKRRAGRAAKTMSNVCG